MGDPRELTCTRKEINPPTPAERPEKDLEGERSEKAKVQDARLGEALCSWRIRGRIQQERQSLDWETVKHLIEKSPSVRIGFEILEGWSGNSLEKAEKTAIREISAFPGWYEIKRKTLTKRLKKVKEDIKMLFRELPEVCPPKLKARKGWEFLGEKQGSGTFELREIPTNLDQVWVDLQGKGDWDIVEGTLARDPGCIVTTMKFYPQAN
jgi:hypothetical protein